MNLNLGALETNWKFLVLDNLNESVLGEDFIERHYTKSRGITDNKYGLMSYHLQAIKCSYGK